jgi:hypothetical protein
VILLVLDGAALPVDADELCEGVLDGRLENAARVVVCDVGMITGPDIGTVDALARFALGARRLGCEVRLAQASPRLLELIDLAGLSYVLPCSDASVVETRGQAEEWEEPGGLEEERDPADPTA